MWLDFSNERPDWDLDFPAAIKVATGKINAVTGEAWRTGLHCDPQDSALLPRPAGGTDVEVERASVSVVSALAAFTTN